MPGEILEYRSAADDRAPSFWPAVGLFLSGGGIVQVGLVILWTVHEDLLLANWRDFLEMIGIVVIPSFASTFVLSVVYSLRRPPRYTPPTSFYGITHLAAGLVAMLLLVAMVDSMQWNALAAYMVLVALLGLSLSRKHQSA